MIPVPDPVLAILQSANQRMEFWLSHLDTWSAGKACSDPMSELLGIILRVGEQLAPIVSGTLDVSMEAELTKYRSNLHQLQQILPTVHARLIQQRARLELERARMQQVAGWTRNVQDSL